MLTNVAALTSGGDGDNHVHMSSSWTMPDVEKLGWGDLGAWDQIDL